MKKHSKEDSRMKSHLGIMFKLGGDTDDFTPQERKIKKFIRENLRTAATLSINDFAKKVGVSKSTLSRFCRRLGYESYRDFSLALAEESAVAISRINEGVVQGETASDIAIAILNTERKALEQSCEMLQSVDLSAIADHLLQANRVSIFSIGGSACAAMDLYHKLSRLGIPCAMQSDMTFQKVLVSQAKAGDVAFVISLSGYDYDMIKIAHKARSQGATVISMVNDYDCPLAKESDHLIYGAFLDNFLYTGTTESRLSLMYIIDVLFTLLSIRGAPETIVNLQETKVLLTERTIQKD